ncbi:MAG: S-methyl-5-thioribose-1-phosphate isomerase [Deltaproteobacteria bacterium]|nr:S-methyl-5-thioribose-1-phosphate isomerase [Deltaproteobacteria bacterium]
MIRPIYWEAGRVVMIDQKLLPDREEYLTFSDYHDVVAAINDLTVRGAPAVGIAAAMGIALGTSVLPAESMDDLRVRFYRICDEFARTRPTAVNLFWAIDRMKRCFETGAGSSIMSLKKALVDEACHVLEEDIAANRRIGEIGSAFIADGDSILTHCNAGALATGGHGTALGIIRTARDEGKKVHVFIDETRPVLQGARLTAWEMMREKIPATLITDNMAGWAMKQGKVNMVIVGADRIAANGDTANKIGTYSLAVLAEEHGIPFYVAAPRSSIDRSIPDGSAIPVEERNGTEVTVWRGIPVAPAGVAVYNPAFDITPGELITTIITEAGTAHPPYEDAIGRLFEG